MRLIDFCRKVVPIGYGHSIEYVQKLNQYAHDVIDIILDDATKM